MANTKISAEAPATTLTGAELLLGVQGGVNVQITAAQLATLAGPASATGLSASSAGFRGMPQNSQVAAYTVVAADSGRHIYHPSTDTLARIWTIDSNANVAFSVGTAITFDNDFGAGAITIAIIADTLVLVGTAGLTGSRTLAAGGQATALKVGPTRWRISGVGLT